MTSIHDLFWPLLTVPWCHAITMQCPSHHVRVGEMTRDLYFPIISTQYQRFPLCCQHWLLANCMMAEWQKRCLTYDIYLNILNEYLCHHCTFMKLTTILFLFYQIFWCWLLIICNQLLNTIFIIKYLRYMYIIIILVHQKWGKKGVISLKSMLGKMNMSMKLKIWNMKRLAQQKPAVLS